MLAIRVWKEPGYSGQIQYWEDVAEGIRRVAIEGLLALPRVGLGIGGLLLGSHDDQGITIVAFVPIPCPHSSGPAFQLTEEETAMAQIHAQEFSVVGCYLSKPGRVKDLSESDLNFYSIFCPKPWQIMLKIKPSTVQETLAAAYFRDSSGTMIEGEERPLISDASLETELETEPEKEPIPQELVANPPALVEAARTVSGRTVALLIIAAVLAGGAIEFLLLLR